MRRVTFLTTILVLIAMAGNLCLLAQTPSPTRTNAAELADRAERLFKEGTDLWVEGTPAALKAAAQKFVEAAEIGHRLGSKQFEAIAWAAAGNTYNLLGQKQKALDHYLNAYNVNQTDDQKLSADIETNVGLLLHHQGDYGRALTIFDHELTVRRELKDIPGEVAALHNIAMIYNDLGDMEKARMIYDDILKVERQGYGDKRMMSATINNLAYVYYRMENYTKAAEMYQEAYQIGLTGGYEDVQCATQIGLGDAFHKLNDQKKAIIYYNRGLELAIKIRQRVFEGDARWGLGTVYQKLGDRQRAVGYYEQALALQEAVGAREQASKTLGDLMSVWRELGQPRLAILYGKRAVNLNQTMRSMIKDLEKDTQRLYLRSKEYAYRQLSDLLIADGRLPEAQGVLDLLKEQEYEQFAKLRSGEAATTVPYSKAESDTITKIDTLAALIKTRNELEEKDQLTADEQTRLDSTVRDIEVANRAFRLSLEALGKDETSVTGKILEIEADKNLQRAMTTLRRELKTGVVALYTVIGTDEVKSPSGSAAKFKTTFGWVIMVTPEGRKAYPIDVTALQDNVQQFRDALRSSHYDPKPMAQKLYNAIFRQTSPKQKKTLERDLAEVFTNYKDRTIMWSLDGVLRYVPVAALHDGTSYLVEKYRNTVFTKQSLLPLTERDAPKWETLGLGVSEAKTVDDQRFIGLDGAKRELEDIVRQPDEKTGILDGTRKLNKDFTKDSTLRLLRGGKYQAVHIASHFSFNAVDPTASFLVIGDGKLTFADIQDKDNLLGSVDLLTLSACDTAMSSNGKESEGFPFLAQSLGAKTVIASLWKVSDTGTPELMIRFYKLRAENPSLSKGEAFRLAQLSLLTGAATPASPAGDTKRRRSDPVDMGESGSRLTPYVADPAKPFAHPHYWASFVLIGNWR